MGTVQSVPQTAAALACAACPDAWEVHATRTAEVVPWKAKTSSSLVSRDTAGRGQTTYLHIACPLNGNGCTCASTKATDKVCRTHLSLHVCRGNCYVFEKSVCVFEMLWGRYNMGGCGLS